MSNFIYLDDLELQAEVFADNVKTGYYEYCNSYPHDPAYDAWCDQQNKLMRREEGLPEVFPYEELPSGATTLQADCRGEGGHKMLRGCSSHGPDSGNMDHCCDHCGAYFSCPLY